MRIEQNFSRNILLLIASLTSIGVATISPYHFAIPTGFSERYILQEFRFGSSLKDYWQNILLFLSFGFSLTSLTAAIRRQLTILNTLVLGAIASVLLSSTIETTQLFLPTRVSNVSDIICNGLGGLLGAMLCLWRDRIGRLILGLLTQDRRLLSWKSLLGAIAGYCTLVSIVITTFFTNINLSNWNNDFYLTIGNEATGDRPWNGQISNLYISDRGLNQKEVKTVFEQPAAFFARSSNLVTSFNFAERQNYYSDRSQHLADLLWQYSQPDPINHQSRNRGILVNNRQWLQTAEAATSLNQKLAKAGEFSLYLTIASNKTEQFGPARIMTLSDGLYQRNILLGQSGQDLSLRLRTPISGRNGTQPEFIVPKVFARLDVCRILITFAHRKLNIYLNSDRTHYSFEFTPATSFWSYFPLKITGWSVNLDEFRAYQYQLMFILIVATPLSILTIALLRFLIPLQ